MAIKKNAQDRLPKRIYVKWEAPPNGAPYLEAAETPNSLEDGDTVGIYELVETRKMKVTQELV
jgi:hypothetical protein